jgi:hypothetical protein
MTTIKNIFNKLHKADKIELATEKIELSVAGDLKDLLNSLNKMEGRFLMTFGMLENSQEELEKRKEIHNDNIEDANSLLQETDSELRNAWNTVSRAEDLAEELGVPESDIANYEQVKELFERLSQEYSEKLENLVKQVGF